VPGATLTAKSFVTASTWRPGGVEVAVSEPTIAEPVWALLYATTTVKSHL
jgi:hypothetical protein